MVAHVLLIPYPAQRHLLPLLDLAHHLAAACLSITIAIPTANLPFLSPLLSLSPTIQPLVLAFPSHPSLPAGVANATNLPPGGFFSLMHALYSLQAPLLQWAKTHPFPPTAIISDMFLGWTFNLAAELNVPRLVFSPSGALTISVVNSLWTYMPKRTNSNNPNELISFPSIPGKPTYPWRQLSLIYRSYKESDPVWELIRSCFINNINSWGYVFNTCDVLESKYLEHIRVQTERVWAIGPLSTPVKDRGRPTSVTAEEILYWLNKLTMVRWCMYVSGARRCWGHQKLASETHLASETVIFGCVSCWSFTLFSNQSATNLLPVRYIRSLWAQLAWSSWT